MKKTTINYVLILLVTLLTTSCLTKQYVPFAHSVNTKGSKIYVFRPSNYAGTTGMKVFADDKFVGRTGPRGYLCFEINEGVHIISTKAEDRASTPIIAQVGKSYYILQVAEQGVLRARVRSYEITENEGNRLIERNDLIQPIIE